MYAATISTKYQVVIPLEVRKQFGLKPGQKVVFIPHKKSLRMLIVPPIEEAEGFLQDMVTNFQRDEEETLDAIAWMANRQVIGMTQEIAIQAADLSGEHKLVMADSFIYATARAFHATLWTQDAHFAGLEDVEYIKKKK